MSGSQIVPRWEWRCFASSLAGIVEKIELPANLSARESDETYVLRPGGQTPYNIKIRGGQLDVKRLRQTSPEGLEQWEPIFKSGFPLARKDVVALLGPATPARDTFSLDELLAFVASQPALRAVAIHKSRRGFSYGGCIAELARITGQGIALESFSLEHEDSGLILGALSALHLDGHTNTSYPVGLARALGLEIVATPAGS